MNCLNNDYYFKRRNKTIYQQFVLLKNKRAFRTVNDEIAFITEKLLYSGLDDVVTIDKKWQEYTGLVESMDKHTYLSFIVSIIETYHKNNDRFDVTVNLDDI